MIAIFNKAFVSIELYLHALVDDLSYRHPILGDCQYMQDILHTSSLTNVAKRDISDVLDCVDDVITSLHEPGLLRLLRHEPLLHGSSYGWKLLSQRTTPLSVLRFLLPLNWHDAS